MRPPVVQQIHSDYLAQRYPQFTVARGVRGNGLVFMRRPGRKILAVAVGRLAGMRDRDPNTVSVLLWARTADIR